MRAASRIRLVTRGARRVDVGPGMGGSLRVHSAPDNDGGTYAFLGFSSPNLYTELCYELAVVF